LRASHWEPGTSLHCHNRALGGLEEPKESIPPELSFLNDSACRICSDDVENVLTDVDAENRGRLRLLA
jgi:hypothetical protein